MAGDNLGKKFEAQFKKNWLQTFPKSFIYRLNDQLSGYKVVSANPSDFICYTNGLLFLNECKSHSGASLPFDCIRQYEQLLSYCDIPGVKAGVIFWLYDKDIVAYIPVKTIKQMKDDGEKSVGIRNFEKYNILVLPGVKKRTFIDTDYTKLLEV